ncbi:MAG TPA: DM13 domain-containing protein [Candidatus Limnocylindrales bacterium]|nr:DM13 domain-containing protein [Candidatus Limnocylindrales bacterium]
MDDLARTFFDLLYDQRVPIAIATACAVVLAALVAWRKGWLASARRHPRRSGLVLALAVAVGAPLTWYLASPIWIRTALIEPGPTDAPASPAASVATVPSESASASDPAPSTSPMDPLPTESPFVPKTVAMGEFAGTDDFHFGRGTASLIEVESGRYHLRLEDFSVRNGPDLYVYLSTDADDYADDALELGRLKATDGSFGYDVPKGTDVGRFRSAIIWCKQFSHLFAVAPF